MRTYRHGDKEYVAKHPPDHNGLIRLYLKEDESITVVINEDRLEREEYILVISNKDEKD